MKKTSGCHNKYSATLLISFISIALYSIIVHINVQQFVQQFLTMNDDF